MPIGKGEAMVRCDCGAVLKRKSMYAHVRTNKHANALGGGGDRRGKYVESDGSSEDDSPLPEPIPRGRGRRARDPEPESESESEGSESYSGSEISSDYSDSGSDEEGSQSDPGLSRKFREAPWM